MSFLMAPPGVLADFTAKARSLNFLTGEKKPFLYTHRDDLSWDAQASDQVMEYFSGARGVGTSVLTRSKLPLGDTSNARNFLIGIFGVSIFWVNEQAYTEATANASGRAVAAAIENSSIELAVGGNTIGQADGLDARVKGQGAGTPGSLGGDFGGRAANAGVYLGALHYYNADEAFTALVTRKGGDMPATNAATVRLRIHTVVAEK